MEAEMVKNENEREERLGVCIPPYIMGLTHMISDPLLDS